MTLKERIEQAQESIKATQAKIKDASETVQIAAMLSKDELDKKVAEAKGSLAAAQENARIISEEAGARKLMLQSKLLKAHSDATRVPGPRSKEGGGGGEGWDKGRDRLEDLVAYAEGCEAIAAQLVIECYMAMLEAAAEVVVGITSGKGEGG